MTEQTPDIEDKETVKAGFWKRQFQPKATSGQIKFDWWFGVILPVVCVLADPIIFKTWGDREGLVSMFKPFAYLLSFTSIMAMMAWLIWGKKLKELNAVLAGLFIFGSLVSLVVGILLSPFSLMGIMLVIGILGFVPLFSAFVYFRNGVRAFREAGALLEKRVLIGTVVLSAVFSGLIPWTINIEIDAHRPYEQQWFKDLRGV